MASGWRSGGGRIANFGLASHFDDIILGQEIELHVELRLSIKRNVSPRRYRVSRNSPPLGQILQGNAFLKGQS